MRVRRDAIVGGKPEPERQRYRLGGIPLEEHELGAGWQRRWSWGPRQCGCVRDDDLGGRGGRCPGLGRERRGKDRQTTKRDEGTERHHGLQVIGYRMLAHHSTLDKYDVLIDHIG